MDRLSDMKEGIAAEMNGQVDPAESGDVEVIEENEGQIQDENANPETKEQIPDDGEAVEADMITDEDVIDYLFEKHPEVTGIYATNGDSVKQAVEALERNESKASVVGFDADTEELDALKDGAVEALVLQNPFGMGYAAVIASARAALSMGNEAVVDTGYTWITKKNLKDEEIQKLLYQ